MGGQRHAPAALSPRKNRFPSYRRLGGPQCRSGQVRKISSPPGFDPRTVQLVASCYTELNYPGPCFVWILQQIASVFLYTITKFIFIKPIQCVFCKIGNKYVDFIQTNSKLRSLFSYDSSSTCLLLSPIHPILVFQGVKTAGMWSSIHHHVVIPTPLYQFIQLHCSAYNVIPRSRSQHEIHGD